MLINTEKNLNVIVINFLKMKKKTQINTINIRQKRKKTIKVIKYNKLYTISTESELSYNFIDY